MSDAGDAAVAGLLSELVGIDSVNPSLVPGAADAVRTVVLNGHLDTVGVTGMAGPFSPRVEDDRLHGRAAADMKGGVAGIVVAAERLVQLGAPVRPVLALVADEEDASVGSEAVIAALPGLGIRPDVCLITAATFDAPYWMEAPLWQELCPTTVCGPSGGGLHAIDEWVHLGQVRSFARAPVEVLSGAD
jgi:acetylornithine deacetylase/succinyl-diaminopimelate desuccinylase-like protein